MPLSMPPGLFPAYTPGPAAAPVAPLSMPPGLLAAYTGAASGPPPVVAPAPLSYPLHLTAALGLPAVAVPACTAIVPPSYYYYLFTSAPVPPPDLMAAIYNLLRSSPSLAAVTGGFWYQEAAGAAAYPFVVFDQADDDEIGESYDDATAGVLFDLHHPDPDECKRLGEALARAVDATRTARAPLAWAGGVECGCMIAAKTFGRDGATRGRRGDRVWVYSVDFTFLYRPTYA